MIYYRNCIQITAKDSPNVQLALWQLEQGMTPTGQEVVPGVLSWRNYLKKLATFDAQRIAESLEAIWYEGAEIRLVPDDWLKFAKEYAKRRPPIIRTSGKKWMGVDPGEGGDDTAFCIGDKHGVVALESLKTPDTNVVYGKTCLLAREWNIAWEDILFDYGGGGKEHVDRFRAAGLHVRGLRFGTIKKEIKRGMTLHQEKVEVEEENASYTNRRSEMAYEVRSLLERPGVITDPLVLDAMARAGAKKGVEKDCFALPVPLCNELIRQIEAIPLEYDQYGRFQLIPKIKKTAGGELDPKCFKARIGRSPDQFDAFCLMVYGMRNPPHTMTTGSS